jgi:hypothetical protein
MAWLLFSRYKESVEVVVPRDLISLVSTTATRLVDGRSDRPDIT